MHVACQAGCCNLNDATQIRATWEEINRVGASRQTRAWRSVPGVVLLESQNSLQFRAFP